MKAILFDARVIRPGMTGIGNYARNLLRAMPTDAIRVGILLPKDSPYADDFPGCTIHFTRVPLTSHPWTELYEQFEIPRLCRRHGYGHFASFEGRIPYFKGSLRTYPFLYDFAYKRFPGTHGWKYSLLLRLSQWIAKRTATRIVTISETIKSQIVTDLGIIAERIIVAYPSDSGLQAIKPVPVGDARTPFVLATSMTNPRKNLATLLRAFAFLQAKQPDLQLVVTGHPEWIHKCLRENPVPGVLNAGFATEGQLRFLYEQADVLIYPSFDEGFGIPLLDAALAGCPIVCSDLPVFREVLGTEACYFDPSSPESIAAAIVSVEAKRSGDISAISGRFSWKRSAQGFLDGLQSD